MEEVWFELVAVTFFGEKQVARCSTLEEAEQRAVEMNEHAERNPRGYVQYIVRPTERRPGGGGPRRA